MNNRDHIKNILKDYFKNGGTAVVDAIAVYAPRADKSFVLSTVKAFKSNGEFSEAVLIQYADMLLEYQPIPNKVDRSTRSQPIIEEN